MVTDLSNKDALLPDRHKQQELFLCDVVDAVIKDDMASMGLPVFTLSKKPDLNIRVYEHNGNSLEVIPSVKGLATIYDKDILIYGISQLIAAKNAGRPINQTIVVSARDFLIFTNRYTNAQYYKLLEDALVRLSGTQIKTNVKTGKEEQLDVFHLVESAHIRRNEKTGRVMELRIKLSDWLFNAVEAYEVLTLHPDYFRLRKPIERRIYELARKHCGKHEMWPISLELLKKKCGSNSPTKHFRYLVRELVKHDHLPDYCVAFNKEKDQVIFRSRDFQAKVEATYDRIPPLSSEVYEEARRYAPGWDIYMIEDHWRGWIANKGKGHPDNPEKAFLGFCRRWYKERGTP